MNVFVEKHYTGIRKKAYRLFINLAKALKLVSTGVTGVFHINKNIKKLKQPKAIILLGLQTHCRDLTMALEKTNAKVQIVATIDTPVNVVTNQQQLKEIINKNEAQSVVFCLDDISVMEAITAIQKNALSVDYFFHHVGSGSIVGSSNKDDRGNCIALN
jgi:hypothetical protein